MADGHRERIKGSDQTLDERFEYGILHVRTNEQHRTGMSLDQATDWLCGWVADGGDPESFSIIRRELGPWEKP